MKLFKGTIPSIEKTTNFHLFATSANDKKECQMIVLNRGLSPSHPSDLPIVKGSCNPQPKIKIPSTECDHSLKHSMSTQKKICIVVSISLLSIVNKLPNDDVAIQR